MLVRHKSGSTENRNQMKSPDKPHQRGESFVSIQSEAGIHVLATGGPSFLGVLGGVCFWICFCVLPLYVYAGVVSPVISLAILIPIQVRILSEPRFETSIGREGIEVRQSYFGRQFSNDAISFSDVSSVSVVAGSIRHHVVARCRDGSDVVLASFMRNSDAIHTQRWLSGGGPQS